MEVSMSSPAANGARTGRGRWRWSVALVATIAMVVSGSGLVVFAQSGAGASKGPAFLPADTTVYVEGRLDLPGGQMDAMAQFLTAFPGFADSGTFGMKLDEALDGLMAEGSGGEFSYTEDLLPLMTGEIGVGLMNVAEAAMGNAEPDILAGVAVSDTAAAAAFVDGLTQTETGSGLVAESYADVTILSDESGAIATVGDWVLMAPTAEVVKTGIDVLSGAEPSLADTDTFAAAWARVPAAHVLAAYMDLQSLASFAELGALLAAGETGMELPTGDLAAQLPIDMVAYLVAESDRMTLQATITPAAGTPTVAVSDSDLATVFPANTQLYIETRELGSTLEGALSTLLASMDEEAAAELAPFEDMLGASLPKFLDFIADASIGAALSSDGIWLGIAAEVTDEDAAAKRVERILSLIRLLASGMGSDTESGVSVDTEMIAGTEVTVITLPIEGAAAEAGLPFDIGQTISVAVDEGMLLIGLGDFVETALTQAAPDSLAASVGYSDAIGADTVNSGVVYANIGALLAELDPLLSLMAPEWADIQPYATALDRFIAVGTADDEVISARMSIIVGQ
jgi:hypothetical protein